jgi:hypothetical protein
MPTIHPMAFAMARSLPGEVALALAVYPLGAVSIDGVPGGNYKTDPEDHVLLRDACRAMTYQCRICEHQRRVDEWSIDSLGTELCERCYEEAGLENEHQDGYHEDAPHPDCPDCR